MREVGAFDAKNNFGNLLNAVEQGEEIVITRHGRPVARLVPNEGRINPSEALAALQRIRSRAPQWAMGKFSWEAVKADRDAGRK
jgi:prevent-host-death family protein